MHFEVSMFMTENVYRNHFVFFFEDPVPCRNLGSCDLYRGRAGAGQTAVQLNPSVPHMFSGEDRWGLGLRLVGFTSKSLTRIF